NPSRDNLPCAMDSHDCKRVCRGGQPDDGGPICGRAFLSAAPRRDRARPTTQTTDDCRLSGNDALLFHRPASKRQDSLALSSAAVSRATSIDSTQDWPGPTCDRPCHVGQADLGWTTSAARRSALDGLSAGADP